MDKLGRALQELAEAITWHLDNNSALWERLDSYL
jgi:hypothetical protein